MRAFLPRSALTVAALSASARFRRPPVRLPVLLRDGRWTYWSSTANESAREMVLRDDGSGVDLGYPWATMIRRDRARIVYDFNRADGARTIEGTFVQIE